VLGELSSLELHAVFATASHWPRGEGFVSEQSGTHWAAGLLDEVVLLSRLDGVTHFGETGRAEPLSCSTSACLVGAANGGICMRANAARPGLAAAYK